jgi:uncharacterized phage protein gp47/JayE
MATYPLATLGPTVSSTGISIPTYNDVYQSLIATFQSIYGSSIYVAPDSQDGQWLAALASAINDSNQAAVMVFQSFSPTYAQGTNLSSLVKINGLSRLVPTKSTAVGTVVGVAGTVISNGSVADTAGNIWNLPTTVTIPVGGSTSVTVTAQNAGNISAPAGTINVINTAQYGWQSFVSTSNAVVGTAVETDDALRARQALSVDTQAVGILQGMLGAIANVPGVTRYIAYQNSTNATDSNGLPAHSVSAVVAGGSSSAIAAAIQSREWPGMTTYGSTSVTVYNSYGDPEVINYYTLATQQIYFAVTIKALPTYISTTGTLIRNALVNFVNSLDIGEDVYQSQAVAAASLINQAEGGTFYITSLFLGTTAVPTTTTNIAIPFNQAGACVIGNITFTQT